MKIGIADKDEERGIGRTSDQMRAAPKGSLFIVPAGSGRRGYFFHLAHHLGRGDLRIESVSVLDGDFLRGLEFPAVVVDHGVRVTDRQGEKLDRLMPMICRRRVA